MTYESYAVRVTDGFGSQQVTEIRPKLVYSFIEELNEQLSNIESRGGRLAGQFVVDLTTRSEDKPEYSSSQRALPHVVLIAEFPHD